MNNRGWWICDLLGDNDIVDTLLNNVLSSLHTRSSLTHSLTRPQAQACSPKTAPWLAPHNAVHIVAVPKLVQNV